MARLINLTGRLFGRLHVIERASTNKNNKPAWFCGCSCGNNVIVVGNSLRKGLTTSCGCYRSESLSERRQSDLFNQKFGRLRVIGFAYVKDRRTYWKCSCDCGNEKIVVSKSLLNGGTTSCGCYHKELVSEMFKGRTDYCGNNNPNYRPDKTDEEREDDRSYPEYKEWRKLVFYRYNYSCAICGSKEIQAHHIEDYSSNPDLRTEVDNGICLCKKHHIMFHRKYGVKTSNGQQLREFLAGGF